MDWTGGTRKRFAVGKRYALLQKQKSHFARVRANIRDAPDFETNFQPDFLSKDVALQPSRWPKSSRRDDSRRFGDECARSQPAEGRRANLTHIHGYREQERIVVNHGIANRVSPSSARIDPSDLPSSVYWPSSLHEGPHAHTSILSQPQPCFEPPGHMTTQDELLSAKRRHLLARTDWLGLAVTKPLRMKFPSSSEKNRIGKRRKIEGLARRAKPAQRRLLTPLFESRLIHPNHLLTGGLAQEDMRIKIGTDAFASQTQRSRNSHTPINTLFPEPSTELGSLSEESMLIDADYDAFDADGFQKTQVPVVDHSGSPTFSVVTCDNSDFETDAQQVPGSPTMGFIPAGPYAPLGVAAHERPTASITTGLQTEPQPESHECEKWQKRQANAGRPEDLLPQCSSPYLEDNARDLQRDLEGSENVEQNWRSRMNTQSRAWSRDSMAALKLSSRHNITSSSSDQLGFSQSRSIGLETNPKVSTLQAPDIQGSILHPMEGAVPPRGALALSVEPPSPSTSLEQIAKLASLPAPRERPEIDHDEENAIWRRFVYGSDESDAMERHGRDRRAGNAHSETGQASVFSAFAISGLGTSDKAVLGD